MHRDPFSSLARLRRLDLRVAQGRLAEARERLAAEHAAAAAAEAELRGAAPSAAPHTYGAFLARMLDLRQRQAALVAHAEALVEAEREALGTARRAEKVLDALRDRRAVATRRIAARRAQLRLEEASPRD